MPGKPKKKVVKRRLQVDCSPRTLKLLDNIVERTEAGSEAAAVRKAIELYEHCIQHRDRGGEIFLRDAAGGEVKLVLLEGMRYSPQRRLEEADRMGRDPAIQEMFLRELRKASSGPETRKPITEQELQISATEMNIDVEEVKKVAHEYGQKIEGAEDEGGVMKMCQQHWVALRAAIDARGLSHLIAKNGEAAVEKTLGELQGQAESETYDPLLSAYFAIMGNALEMGGMYLLTGDFCPICESEAHGVHPAEWWFTHAADEQLQRAKELGLVVTS